jgi:mRNA-degrading endonuclease RelE of RelBE toxin-antitoxin system
LKKLAVSRHFQKQLQKLPQQDQERTVETLKEFLTALGNKKIPLGLGFKKINGDKYELRVDIRLRVALKLGGDTFVCHLVGNHEDIKKYLKDYR